MTITDMAADDRGATSVEFALSAPLFAFMIAGAIGAGLVFWAQLGLQHGVEMAARCASINKVTCADSIAIKNYAVAQTAGVNPPASAFSVSTSACGTLVSASYPLVAVPALWGLAPFTLTAQACYPK